MINERRGTVSITVAMMLAAIMLLEAVLIQGTWVFTAKANLDYKLQLAGQSILARFDTLLYEDYGLVATKEYDEASELAEFYFLGEGQDRNMISLLSSDFKPGDYLRIVPFKGEAGDFLITYDKKLGDLDVFQKEISNLMQYKTPENITEFVLEQTGLIEEAESSDNVKEKYEEACEVLNSLSLKVNELYHTVCGYSSHDIACVNGYDDLDARTRYVNKIYSLSFLLNGKKISEITDKDDKENLKDMKNQFALLIADYKTYREWNNKALQKYREVANERTNTEKSVKDFKQYLASSEDAEKSNSDFMDKLNDKIKETEDMLKKTKYTSVKTQLEENIKILDKQTEKVQKVFEKLKNDDYVISKSEINDCLNGYQLGNLHTDISVYHGEGGYNAELASQDPTADADNAEGNCTVDVDSNKEIKGDLYDSLPSKTNNSKLTEYDVIDRILTDDYIATYFSNATDESFDRYRILNGEAEYILHGDRKDKKNIENTLLKIFGIRSAFNFLYIITDKEKVRLARAIGSAMASATTCAIAEPIFTAIVLTGWALCEAGMDVSALKKGEKVPLVKTKETWRLSISGLDDIAHDNNPEDEDEKRGFAMNYEGYLRLLLFTMDQETKLLRIQDLIEANLSEATEGSFKLGDYSTSVITSCNFYVPINALVDSYLDTERKGFTISGEVQVTY